MNSIFYHPRRLLDQVNISVLLVNVDAATRALIRLDERLAERTDLARGVQARGQYFDACASVYLSGDLVRMEELVLFDAGAGTEVPSPALSEASRRVERRRTLSRQTIQNEITIATVNALTAKERSEMEEVVPSAQPEVEEDDPFSALFADLDRASASAELALVRHKKGVGAHTDTSQSFHADRIGQETGTSQSDRLKSWLALQGELDDYPPVLAAALLWDAWEHMRPIRDDQDLCRLLVGRFLQQHLTPSYAPLLAHGLRTSPQKWRTGDPPETRLKALLLAIENSVKATSKQLDALSIGLKRMQRYEAGLSVNARLSELIELFLRYPLISRGMAANLLGVTPRGIDSMFAQLGPALPRELTGRKRYRLWGLL